MKIPYILFVMILTMSASASYGQVPGACGLTADKAPLLFGFKLGMSQEKVEAMLGVKAEANIREVRLPKPGGSRHGGPRVNIDLGDKVMEIDNFDRPSRALDPTILKLSLSFYEGKIFGIYILGGDKTPWAAMDDAGPYFEKNYNIPLKAWDPPSTEINTLHGAKCNGVKFFYEQSGGPTTMFSISNTDVDARLAAALEAAKEKARTEKQP